MAEGRISIIVPALNEQAGIAATLAGLQALRKRGHEVIVVDAGSRDATRRIAASCADRVLQSAPCRATQMNAGARLARGSVLWFLHADTQVPSAADSRILAALKRNPARCWGRFDVSIDGEHRFLRVVAAAMNLRSRVTGIATGDQGIFVTRSVFEAVGGYPAQPLMEDIEISRRLRRISPPLCLGSRLATSGRRWERDGVTRTVLTMWWFRLVYYLGARPEKLSARYHKSVS
jgi:rSAM/selenodomain-associated transferase 2